MHKCKSWQQVAAILRHPTHWKWGSMIFHLMLMQNSEVPLWCRRQFAVDCFPAFTEKFRGYSDSLMSHCCKEQLYKHIHPNLCIRNPDSWWNTSANCKIIIYYVHTVHIQYTHAHTCIYIYTVYIKAMLWVLSKHSFFIQI